MNETHIEYMRVSFAFSFAFVVVSFPLSILASILAYLLWGSLRTATIVAVSILLTAGIIIAGVLILSLRTSQAILVDLLVADAESTVRIEEIANELLGAAGYKSLGSR